MALNRQHLTAISVWFLALFMAVLPITTAQGQSAWPGSGRTDITQAGVGMGSNLSGAVWNPYTNKLWLVSNSGLFWRMSCPNDPNVNCGVKSSWSIDGNGAAEWHTGGDTEAITQGADWSEDTVFIAVEGSGIEEYDVSGPLGNVNRVRRWSLTEPFNPGPGSGGSGLEALTFVPDEWLTGFRDGNGNLYESSQFGTGGLFFAGLQADGHIYVYDLNRTSTGATHHFVGQYGTGQNEIAGLEFDRSDGSLYSYHNGSGSSNQDVVQSLSLVPNGGSLPFLRRWFGPRVENNEGIALVPSNPSVDSDGNAVRTCEADGQRHFYLTTDDAGDSNSLGIYRFPCTPTFTSVAATTASVDVAYQYDVEATGSGTITYSLIHGPAGMSVAGNGLVSWTPTAAQEGTHTVSIQAQNSFNFVAAQTFTVTVDASPPVNDAPSFTKGADQTVTAGTGVQTVVGWATDISAGAVGQVTAFNVSNNNTGLFSTQPSITAAGTLSYTPGASAGVATVTVTLSDNGGTENGGVNISDPQTFTITVAPINDAPSFTLAGASQTVSEDAVAQSVPGWATGISAGTVGTVTNFNVSNNNTGLFSAQPSVALNGTLTYTPAANANGSALVTVSLSDDGGMDGGGIDTSANQTFTINVTAVNDAPSFAKGANQSVLEGTTGLQTVPVWATSISAGPTDESGQALTFNVSNNNTGLFSVQPSITSNGTLSYKPNGVVGSATVTVALSDNGGKAGGGADTADPQTFTINVTAVNDAPSFTAGLDQTVLEDSGAQSVAWATSITAGAVGSITMFTVSNNNSGLFSAQPSIALNGTLTYRPAANANGSALVTVTLSDDGGTAGGGFDTSGPQTFTINVTAVNDTPSFIKGADQIVLVGAGAQSVSGWATGISKGPADESGQTLTFNVTNDNNSLFSVQPSIAANGTLSYTPGPSAGSATVTVSLSDDGGGADTLAEQTFTITVNPVVTTPQVVFADSFENGLGNWTQNQNDWFSATRRATDGSRSAEVDGSANDAELVSPVIDVAGRTTATVTFSWYIESNWDTGEYLAFDVSVDGGQTWQLNKAILQGNVAGDEDTTHNETVTVDIPSGATSLRLRFRAKVSGSGEDGNLDNVIVTVSGSGPAPTNAPVAEFNAVPAALQVSFSDASTIGSFPINAWSWDFGDGSSPSTEQNPTHIYGAGGSYNVTLTVTDTDNKTGSVTHSVSVSEPGTEEIVFADSFENGLGLWTQDSQNDWFTRNRRATDGSFSAEVDGSANDATISRDIDMQGRTAATITFSWYIESGFDSGEYLAFDVSTDGGATWVERASLRGNVDQEGTTHHVSVDVTGAASLMIRFRAKVSDSSEDGNLDNVVVTAR